MASICGKDAHMVPPACLYFGTCETFRLQALHAHDYCFVPAAIFHFRSAWVVFLQWVGPWRTLRLIGSTAPWSGPALGVRLAGYSSQFHQLLARRRTTTPQRHVPWNSMWRSCPVCWIVHPSSSWILSVSRCRHVITWGNNSIQTE